MQRTTLKRNFPSYFRNTFAAALGIEILCITSAEIGENLGLIYFGFNQIGIAIAIVLGFAFAGFSTFVTILGKSHGKHIHGCCSVLETESNLSFLQNLKTTFADFGKGLKKLTRFHKEPEAKHILKESIYILVTAESGCIIVAEIVALVLYQHSLILSFPIALLAGTAMIVVTTFDKRTRYFIPVLILILASMPFVLTSAEGTGFHFHTFTAFDSTPDPSKLSLFQNLTYVQGFVHGTHVHPGYMAGLTSAKESIITSEQLIINNRQYVLDIIILAGTTDLDIPREFSFKLKDKTTDEIQKNVTYLFSIKQYGKTIFEETFQRDGGNLFVKIIPEDPFKLFFEEESKIIRSTESLPGLDGRLEVVRGPILDSVGVYEVSLEILSIGSYSNLLESPLTHNGFLTLSDIQTHNVLDSRYEKQEIASVNDLAKIENFEYLEEKNQIKFNFPVDFLENEPTNLPDLRMSLFLPKTFTPFLARDISVFVNELSLAPQFVQVQDLDDSTKLIQFILPAQSFVEPEQENDKKNFEFIVTPTHSNGFPISLITKDKNYDIRLAWEPSNIVSKNETMFYVMAYDMNNVAKELNYELILSQNDNEYLNLKGKTSHTVPPEPIELSVPTELNGITELELTFNENQQTQVLLPIFINDIS